ncbi:MAG: RNA polymerase factor sigma-54 [Candidatus Omnitrophota bacterium]
MKNTLSQHQKILQKMALTSQMKHSIQLLGMSIEDLNEYVDSILSSNPLLERERPYQAPQYRSAVYEYNDNVNRHHDEHVDARAQLLSQIRTLDLTKEELEISEYLISEMDDNGYIKIDSGVVALELLVDTESVEKVLETIKSLDPAGIGAEDIRECLLLQLKRLGKEDSLEYTLVKDFLSDVAINDIPNIARSLGLDKKEVQEAAQKIRKLNPRPGSTLLSEGAQRIIPDLKASIANEKVRLELSREAIPKLRLYNPYENKLAILKDPKAREFLKKNMTAAKGLIDNIKRREETMCRVAEYILTFQKESINKKNGDIKTLTISQIAKELGLHPSTISRTVSNKYVQIDGRVLPLGHFLSHGMKKENGDITSKVSIKNSIKEFVSQEDKAKPLRDSAIQKKLEAIGINIKRRTVAKYRESLRILPAHLRKKLKSKD